MSQVKIQGNASGTGIFTVAAPNSNTDRTLTLPDVAGTVALTSDIPVAGRGPAFQAQRGSGIQTFSATTWTKLQFNNEIFDTASCYDPSTNYRFTPNVAGYYAIGALWEANNVAGGLVLSIQKNGSSIIAGGGQGGTGVSIGTVHGLIYLNGSTDYLEVYGYMTTNMGGVYDGTISKFYGYLVREA